MWLAYPGSQNRKGEPALRGSVGGNDSVRRDTGICLVKCGRKAEEVEPSHYFPPHRSRLCGGKKPNCRGNVNFLRMLRIPCGVALSCLRCKGSKKIAPGQADAWIINCCVGNFADVACDPAICRLFGNTLRESAALCDPSCRGSCRRRVGCCLVQVVRRFCGRACRCRRR